MNTTVKIESRNKYSNTYGGKIYAFDFEFMSLKGAVNRAISAMHFDYACEKQAWKTSTQRYTENHRYKMN